MSDSHRFSLAGASAAADRGDEEIARWVGDFLASRGGNAVLAAALAQEPHWWFGPIRLRTTELEPLAGPDDRTPCDVAPAVWEEDVDAMQRNLGAGWEPPPLLVEWRDGRLLLQDGNHRHEALLRAGEPDAWVLAYFPSLADRDAFAARYLEEVRLSGRRP